MAHSTMASLVMLLVACTAQPAAAQITSDFTNDLATDLGPLLSLFGENMTKQYLSESTSILDYLIFCLAPIGILTCVTSVIRVTGSPALRAFIGRAQEGQGQVEAELCTSTSRDVCELFNNGGITRVFGRPKILELIQLPEPRGPDHDKQTIFRFQDYLRDVTSRKSYQLEAAFDSSKLSRLHEWNLKPISRWRKLANAALWWREQPTVTAGKFPPNPNITLNVGLDRPRRSVFCAVAILGLALQAGVLLMAGIGTYYFNWSQDADAGSGQKVNKTITERDAAICYIIGTFALSTGMFGCAALIGESTEEKTFKRAVSSEVHRPTQLLWLQPGGQVIGDQTFDAYAHIEDPSSPIKKYTTSRRVEVPEQHLWTNIAVFMTVGGYITQFIGLRGLRASIALVQLAVTLLMSFIRGLLRRRRLKPNDRRVNSALDLIRGHELDWLSLQLDRRCPKHDSTFPYGRQHNAIFEQRWFFDGLAALRPRAGPPDCRCPQEIFKHRHRLAMLTGHQRINQAEAAHWTNEQVIVRKMAYALADVLCRSAEILRRDDQHGDYHISLPISLVDGGNYVTSSVELEIRAPKGDSREWSADAASIEAVLGLWLWAIRCFCAKVEGEPWSTSEEQLLNCDYRQIVRLRTADATNDNKGDDQDHMSLWLGSKDVKLYDGQLEVDSDRVVRTLKSINGTTKGNETIGSWKTTDAIDPEVTWSMRGQDRLPNISKSSMIIRGGNALMHKWLWPSSVPSDTERASCATAECPAKSPLNVSYVCHSGRGGTALIGCATELYAIAIAQLAKGTKIGEIAAEEAFGEVRLRNHTILALQSIFTHSGCHLGSAQDALYCIIPAMRNELRQYDSTALTPILLSAANRSEESQKWDKADAFLRAACQICSAANPTGNNAKAFKTTLFAAAEFYRRLLTSASNHDLANLAYKGFHWLLVTFLHCFDDKVRSGADVDNDETCGVILSRYCALAVLTSRLRKIPNDEVEDMQTILTQTGFDKQFRSSYEQLEAEHRRGDELRSLSHPEIIHADLRRRHAEIFRRYMNDNNRALCLLSLGYCRKATVKSSVFHCYLSEAANKGWEEVVAALLRLGVPVDAGGESNKTALIFAAMIGHDDLIELLLDNGAQVNVTDGTQKSALYFAAKSGHLQIVERLLKASEVFVNGEVLVDGKSVAKYVPLAAAAAAGYLDVVKRLAADPQISLDEVSADGYTALTAAIENDHVEIYQFLIERGATKLEGFDASNGKYHGRATAFASAHNSMKVLDRLLAQDKTSPNETIYYKRSRSGGTALTIAAKNGHTEVVRKLLTRADLDPHAHLSLSSYRTALWLAVDRSNEEIVNLLLSDGRIDPNLQDRVKGEPPRTALCAAIKNRDYTMVDCLLRDARVTLVVDRDTRKVQDPKHELPLQPLAEAIVSTDERIVKRLLSDERINDQHTVEDVFGSRYLANAIWRASHTRQDRRFAILLIEHGGRPHPDDDILHRAIEKGLNDLTKCLLERNICDVNKLSLHALAWERQCFNQETWIHAADQEAKPGATPLHSAILTRNLPAVRMLCEVRECDVNYMMPVDFWGTGRATVSLSPLGHALYTEDRKMANVLLDRADCIPSIGAGRSELRFVMIVDAKGYRPQMITSLILDLIEAIEQLEKSTEVKATDNGDPTLRTLFRSYTTSDGSISGDTTTPSGTTGGDSASLRRTDSDVVD